MTDAIDDWFEPLDDPADRPWLEENLPSFQRVVDDFAVRPDPRVELKIFPSVEAFQAQFPGRAWPKTFIAHHRPPKRIGIVRPGAADSPWKPEGDRARQGRSLVHEFSHFMTGAFMRARGSEYPHGAPKWLMEGIADYHAGSLFAWPGIVERLVPLADVDRLHLGHGYGPFVIAAVVERFGFAGVRRLVERNGDIEAALGCPAADWDARWHDQVRSFAAT
jgi:hypothetical protein